MVPLTNEILEFEKKHGLNFANIDKCIVSSNKIREELVSLFKVIPFSPDNDLVIFGSIARNECTPGSDIDWTLLIDGQANAENLKTANKIRKLISSSGKDPGASGVFGNTIISHDLIHHIGGEQDSNHNLTRRILLLLESEKLAFNEGGTAYDRVITGIIKQYLTNDSGLQSNRNAIPRFLLNDVVRYWRTLCVDFAYKQREQEGKKWALRNIKLRMSRKLLFVKGLLMCFAHYQTRPSLDELADSLRKMVFIKPLELIINLQEHFEIDDRQIISLLTNYDLFLNALNDQNQRDSLENMKMEEVYEKELFLSLRKICDDFQEVLNQIFLGSNNSLKKLTLKYAIF